MKCNLIATTAFAALLAGCGAPGDADGNAAPANVVASDNAAVIAPAEVTNAAADNTAAATDAPALTIDGEGLRLVNGETGSATQLPFGMPRANLERIVASRGKPETGRMEECGEGPTDYANYPDGLQLMFQDGKFAGWAIDNRGKTGLTTMAGLGIGSTRAELAKTYDVQVEESSIGQEFTAGDISGLLDGTKPTSKVTNLWAGVACIAR